MIAFAPFMSSQDDLSRAYIDAFEFARESRRIEGMIPVANLERLADRLIEPTGALRCRIDGERDRQGSYLRVDVVGMLALRCERCLGTMEFPLHVRNRLRLMKPGAEWPEDDLEDDGADAVLERRDDSAAVGRGGKGDVPAPRGRGRGFAGAAVCTAP